MTDYRNEQQPTDLSPTARQPEIVEPYPILRQGVVDELTRVLRDNLGEAGIQTLDLPRIKVPSGGSTVWLFQTLFGEESSKTVEGIIVAWRMGRIYWKLPMDSGGGGKPPDCVSKDSIIGIGDPGGECYKCPFAKYGTSPKGGKGQACKQIRQLLLMRPDEALPWLCVVPPTSLKAASQYFLNLVSRKIPFWGLVSKITLEKAKNESGIEYSKMQFFPGRILSASERARVEPFQKQMQAMLDPGTIDARDYVIEDEPPPPVPPSNDPIDSEIQY